MQNNTSKLNTILLAVVIILLAANIIIMALKKQEVKIVEVPAIESVVQTPIVPVTPSQNPVIPSQPTAETGPFATYVAQGFSFKYDKNMTTASAMGVSVEVVDKANNDNRRSLWLVNGPLPSQYNCSISVANTMVVNGKTIRYCNSQAEPVTLYYYSKNGKTLIIIAPASDTQSGYLDLGSIEIL